MSEMTKGRMIALALGSFAAALLAGVALDLWLLPRLIMLAAERRMTSCVAPTEHCAPHNTFFHSTRLAGPEDRIVVNPNNDTLYSVAWLDLDAGPQVLHVPDTAGRYYTMQFMDAWTNVFGYVGRRTTGTREGRFLIAGPGWSEKAPAGMKVLRAPTSTVWILGRTLTDGPADVANVRALQQQMTLVPLSRYTSGP